jgi:hypothetical protein
MVFNATFNNISAISWRPVLLVEETEVPGWNHRPVASHWQTLSHNVVPSTPRHELTNLVVVDIDCSGVNPTTIPSRPRKPLCHKWPWICSVCRSQFFPHYSFMTYHRVGNKSNMTGSLVKELLTLPYLRWPLVFSGVHVAWSLVFCVVFCRSLFVLLSFS